MSALAQEEELSEDLLETLEEMAGDYPGFAHEFLRIRTKSGQIMPLILNQAQRFIHERLEKQLAETGRVRALVLKGRQQGCSTYTEGRLFWRAVLGEGMRAFILSHESESASGLFEMAKRYYDHLDPDIKPATKRSNKQELVFAGQDCSYRVATAGTEAVGRSETVQLFHGSEVAFWKNAEDHAGGALQTVPDEPGTEVILESTANGMANYFHRMWVKAERGESDYIAIFTPWFWQDEYVRAVPEGATLDEEEQEYADTHGVSMAHMMWRRKKIEDLGPERFRQEYPATAAEAFQTSGKDCLIKPERVMAARKQKVQLHAQGARVGGCDPAGDGGEDQATIEDSDRTAFCIRQGRIILHLETFKGLNTMEIADKCVHLIKFWRLDMMFVDNIGLGAGVVDRVKMLMPGFVRGVNAGHKASQPDRYFNKRAEMAGEMAQWFEDEPVAVPDSDAFQADIQCIRARYNHNSQLKLDDKRWIKKEYGMSPDLYDAAALTFAYHVVPRVPLGDGQVVENDASRARREYKSGSRRARN